MAEWIKLVWHAVSSVFKKGEHDESRTAKSIGLEAVSATDQSMATIPQVIGSSVQSTGVAGIVAANVTAQHITINQVAEQSKVAPVERIFIDKDVRFFYE